MEHVRTTKEPIQPIPTFNQVIALLMKVKAIPLAVTNISRMRFLSLAREHARQV
jgi:hypothetical protein